MEKVESEDIEIHDNNFDKEPVSSFADEKEEKPIKYDKPKKQKKGFFKKLLVFCGIVISAVFLPIFIFLIYSAFDYDNPAYHIPPDFYAVADIPSASTFLRKGLNLSAADYIFSSPETAELQGTLRLLRTNEFLRSHWFNYLADINVTAAVYEENNFAAVANAGIRSAVFRLLPIALKIKPDLLDDVKNLDEYIFDFDEIEVKGFILQQNAGHKVYICFYKNLILAASSEKLLKSAYFRNIGKESRKLLKFLKSGQKNVLTVFTNTNRLTAENRKQKSTISAMLNEVNFPELSTVNLNFDENEIVIKSTVKWETDSPNVKNILERKSEIPSILPLLPRSAAYLTLFNIGSPQYLYENISPFFTDDLKKSFKSAESGAKTLFSKNLHQLIFEWAGSEIGVFAHKDAQAPVFFVSLKDEAKCRKVLDELFATVFLDQNVSAVVDGVRLPQIVTPSWLSSLLRMFKIDLPTPFYIIDNGFLYLSESAEVLMMSKREAESGNLLIKTEQWKKFSENICPETSVLVYYTLERSIPFFLQNSGFLKDILKNYGKGVLSLRFTSGCIDLNLCTQKTEASALGEIPSFPRTFSNSPNADIICAKTSSNLPFVFWAGGNTVHSMNLADGKESSLRIDGKAGIAASFENGKLKALWAVSSKGTIYKTNEYLEAFEGFPILTGEKLNCTPAAIKNGMVVPLFSVPIIFFVNDNAQIFSSEEMENKLKDTPVVFADKVAALPRSFSSLFYVFDNSGKIETGYPVEFDGIFSSQPLIFEGERGKMYAAFLNESGKFSMRSLDLASSAGFDLELETICKAAPVYSKSLKAFFIISNNGELFKINTHGKLIDSLELKTGEADDYKLTLADLNGDGRDELLISGGGNSVYGCTGNFAFIRGFPISGTGTPYLLDIDGNGELELVTHGIDNKFHAYTGVGKW